MSQSPLFEIFAASVDGRLSNVRTRHESLRKISSGLQSRRGEVQAALDAAFPSSDYDFELAFTATLRQLAIHAASLDQPTAVSHRKALAKSARPYTHQLARPVGVVAIELSDDLAAPLDAIFGPLAAAITAGNCVAVAYQDEPKTKKLVQLLQALLSQSLDRESYALVASSRLSADDWIRFGKVVRYQGSSTSEKQSSSKSSQPNGSNVLTVSSKPRHVVVIDHSLFDDRFYRHPSQHPRLTKRENDKLASMIQTINNFSADVATILISETIQPAFQKQWAGTGSQAQAKIVGVTSTLDIIFKIQEQQGEGGLNLYIFAAPATASYYAQQTSPQSVSINAMPNDLAFSYVPTASSAVLQSPLKAMLPIVSNDFVLAPLWSSELFSTETSTVLHHTKPQSSSSKSLQKSAPGASRYAISPMKRGHPDHMEFFPTGFKITFFPLALTILGGLGYGGVKLGLAGYRFARSRY